MRVLVLLFCLVMAQAAVAQSVYVPLNTQVYDVIDRYELRQKRFSPTFHSGFKPYTRQQVAEFAEQVAADSSLALSRTDEFNLNYLLVDNHEWASDSTVARSRKPFLRALYPTKGDAVLLRHKYGQFHFSPVFHFAGGRDQNPDQTLRINTRGLEIRGQVDDRIGFYAWVTENQMRLPNYVQYYTNTNGTVPNEGFWKRFGTNSVDFFSARGYITARVTRHIGMQFGYDKNFVGNGYRSLILSDFAPAATFLKFNTRVGAFQYTNLFAQLKANPTWSPVSGIEASRYIGNKYLALHHLSVNLGPRVNLGLFESVVYSRDSSNAVELTYLNPVIFYRSVEGYLGSPDNVLLGADLKFIPARNVLVYSQVTIDEFIRKRVIAGTGWWGNKQAIQVGAKYANVLGISNLDIQGELNYIRPFTYSHETDFLTYAHYRQPLAHPMGANVREVIGIVRFQPINRLTINGKGIFAKIGEDQPLAGGGSLNFGGDINRSYADVKQSAREYGYRVGSGSPASLRLIEFAASYMLAHNLWLDFQVQQRTYASKIAARDRSDLMVTAGIRLNTYWRKYDF